MESRASAGLGALFVLACIVALPLGLWWLYEYRKQCKIDKQAEEKERSPP